MTRGMYRYGVKLI